MRPGKTGAGKRREILSPLNEKAASPLDNGIYVFFGYMSQSVWPFSGGFNCAFVVFCGFLVHCYQTSLLMTLLPDNTRTAFES